jgi:hypothetical protein
MSPDDRAVATAEVERVLAALAGSLPPEVLDVLREELLEGLTEHPVGRELVRRARPRVAPERSGEVGPQGSAEKKPTGSGGR